MPYLVKILMSTYNGAKYLSEQIDSLLAQKGIKVEIDIRDDGSSDQTQAILKKYSSRNTNIRVNCSDNIGPSNSFMELLYSTDSGYDYYAFCDQDDIWDTDKIIRAIELIRNTRSEGPVLYYSALNTFNTDSYEREFVVNSREYSFEETFFQSHYPGCTMVFNCDGFNLIRKIDRPKVALMHDLFVVQVFMCTHNDIIYDKESRINYRIHGKNVSVKANSIRGELRRKMGILKRQKGLRSAAAASLYDVTRGYAGKAEQEILKILSDYKKNIKTKLKLLRLIRHMKFKKAIRIEAGISVLLNIF